MEKEDSPLQISRRVYFTIIPQEAWQNTTTFITPFLEDNRGDEHIEVPRHLNMLVSSLREILIPVCPGSP